MLRAVAGLVALVAGCSSEPVLHEHTVAAANGRVRDLSLLPLPDESMALGWRDSALPNAAEARAAFMMLGSGGSPRGALLRDDNASEAASALVATQTTILRVLAERGEADAWGLVAVVRDPDSGEQLPDGYRTLPVFAGARLTDLKLVPTVAGALLAWVERGGGELPADFVQLVLLDDDGNPVAEPLALEQLPPEVVAIDLQPWDDGREAVLAALTRRGFSAQVSLFRFRVDETLRLERVRQLGTDLSDDDRVLALERLDDCLELLITEGGAPKHATFDAGHDDGEIPGVTFDALPPTDAPGVAPRLIRSSDTRILYVYDRVDGSTHTSFVDRSEPDDTGDRCRSPRVGAERSFPLSTHRCAALATTPGDPLHYACASACLTEACGDEWIWVGWADL